MGDAERNDSHRHNRLPLRLVCTFKGPGFKIEADSVNISDTGIFIGTDQRLPPGVEGQLRFRPDTWESPLSLRAVVVRAVLEIEGSAKRPPGIGLEFQELTVMEERKLKDWLSGKRTLSIAQSIRQNARAEGNSMQAELRNRSADQKVIFAAQAQGEEIRELIRTGHPAVISRLFENPRLQIAHVRLMLRDPRLKPSQLLDVKRERKYMADPEIRFLFCKHPSAPECEVRPLLPELSVSQLTQLSIVTSVRPNVRIEAKKLLKQKGIRPASGGWG